jgi:hypothetical protein
MFWGTALAVAVAMILLVGTSVWWVPAVAALALAGFCFIKSEL